MNSQLQKQLLNRINRLIGHALSNKKLIQENAYCIDIITQNLAVISALHKLNEKILEDHLLTCVSEAMKKRDPRKQKKVIKEIITIYKKMQ